MQQYDDTFKIILIGNINVGKTSIMTRFIKDQFSLDQQATVGVQFLSKIVEVHNRKIKVMLWDTAGSEKYKSLSSVFYKGTSGVFVVYDVSDPQSYIDIHSWMRQASENLDINDIVMMVMGNKIDDAQNQKVKIDRPLKDYKNKFDIDCWEVSAKTGHNICKAFTHLISKIFEMNVEVRNNLNYGESGYTDSCIDKEQQFSSIIDQDTKNGTKVTPNSRFTMAKSRSNGVRLSYQAAVQNVTVSKRSCFGYLKS